MSPKQPAIVLDATLADLYRSDEVLESGNLVLLPYYWCSDVDYTETLPKTSRYLYQGTDVPQGTSETKDLTIQCLAIECQRFLFVAGNMDAVMFDFSKDGNCRLEAAETLSVLSKGQQTRIDFARGIRDLKRKVKGSRLIVVVPHEGLSSCRQSIHPDTISVDLDSAKNFGHGHTKQQTSLSVDIDFSGNDQSRSRMFGDFVLRKAKWGMSFPRCLSPGDVCF